MNIKNQIDDLQRLFNTKNILDECSRAVMTQTQFDDVISIIQTERKDGIYTIGELSVKLDNGKVIIIDNLET